MERLSYLRTIKKKNYPLKDSKSFAKRSKNNIKFKDLKRFSILPLIDMSQVKLRTRRGLKRNYASFFKLIKFQFGHKFLLKRKFCMLWHILGSYWYVSWRIEQWLLMCTGLRLERRIQEVFSHASINKSMLQFFWIYSFHMSQIPSVAWLDIFVHILTWMCLCPKIYSWIVVNRLF